MASAFPAYDLARVITTRDKIIEASNIHVGTVLVGEFHEDWLLLVHSVLRDVSYKVLQLSSRAMLNRELTDTRLRDFAWLIAGNMHQLRSGRPVTAWFMQAAEEWMPLYVTKAQAGRNRKDEFGHWLTFQIMAGSACPLLTRRFWTTAQSRFVSSRMGYNVRADRPFDGASHFVGMLLYGLFEPKLSEDKPGFQQVRVTATMTKHNRAIIDGRKEKPCPTFHYFHACDACTVGYDRCPLAVHALTFTTGKCTACGNEGVLFDPEHPDHCVACTHNRNTKSTKG